MEATTSTEARKKSWAMPMVMEQPTVPGKPIPGYEGPWEGGRPAGTVIRRKRQYGVNMHMGSQMVWTGFFLRDYATEDAAYRAAVETQKYQSLAYDLTRNRWRVCFDDALAQYYLEVMLTQEQTMKCCLCHMLLQRGAWSASWGKSGFYVAATIDGKKQSYHREVTGAYLTDHINGDTLDNRCVNLRPATQTENKRNHVVRRDNTSGYNGIGFVERKQKYTAAFIRPDGKWSTKGFPVKRHGSKEEALRLALEFRAGVDAQLGITVRPRKQRRLDDESKELVF